MKTLVSYTVEEKKTIKKKMISLETVELICYFLPLLCFFCILSQKKRKINDIIESFDLNFFFFNYIIKWCHRGQGRPTIGPLYMTVIDLKLFLKDQNHAYQFKNSALNMEVRMDLHSICMKNLKDKQYDVIISKNIG